MLGYRFIEITKTSNIFLLTQVSSGDLWYTPLNVTRVPFHVRRGLGKCLFSLHLCIVLNIRVVLFRHCFLFGARTSLGRAVAYMPDSIDRYNSCAIRPFVLMGTTGPADGQNNRKSPGRTSPINVDVEFHSDFFQS